MPDEPKAKGIDEVDDWIAAIDEWASSLSLPTDRAADKTPQPEPLPPTRPAAKAKTEESARSAEREGEGERKREGERKSMGERDPLAELVGGDFELAEEAGEALGPLLSQEGPAAPAGAEAAGREDEVASVLESDILLEEASESLADAYASLAEEFSDFDADSTRVAAVEEVSKLLDSSTDPSGPHPTRPAAPEAGPAEPPPDEDFYDAISIMPGEEELAAAAGGPAPAEATPAVAPAPAAEEVEMARAADPDRTPIPIFDDAQGELSQPSAEPRPVEPARLVIDGAAVELALPERVRPEPLARDYLLKQLARLDRELRLAGEDHARAAEIAAWAGRLAERLEDSAGAVERYGAALAHDARSQPALAGLCRLRLAQGDRQQALELLGRELVLAADAERAGLLALKTELESVLGRGAQHQPGAAAEAAEPLPGLEALVEPSSDEALKAALLAERGRQTEWAGEGESAAAHYRAALASKAPPPSAAFGMLRLAWRSADGASTLEGGQQLAAWLAPGPLRAAVERRLGLDRWRAGDLAGARAALGAAATEDALSLLPLADLEQTEGRLDEASRALERAVEAEADAGRRSGLRIRLGELHEQRGDTAQAAACFAAAAKEYPEDPRAQRGLERTDRAEGDKEQELKAHLARAERDPAHAQLEWTHAARLLIELGRTDEARARLETTLAAEPAGLEAVELAVELALADGDAAGAAGILVRAAQASEDSALASLRRERAARLFFKAGRNQEALAEARAAMANGGSLAARWLEQTLLAAAGASGAASAVERAAALEAEAQAVDSRDQRRVAALWHERGLILELVAPPSQDAAWESQRRALELDPAHGPAAVALATHLAQGESRKLLASVYQTRLLAAGERAEGIVLALRLGRALELDACDPGAAADVYGRLLGRARDSAGVRRALDRTGRQAKRDDARAQALEAQLGSETRPEVRLALLLERGDCLARMGSSEAAADSYRRALELRPRHPRGRAGLERALIAASQVSQLTDLALSDLKEAPDTRHKVHAYEQLAMIDGELRGDAQSALLACESIAELDPTHHHALRTLERHYLAEQRFAELLGLYHQMALSASTPAFAVTLHLECARLRAAWGDTQLAPEQITAQIDGEHRLALKREPRSRPALRHLVARARLDRDEAQMGELFTRLGEAAEPDARAGAVYLVRAAEALMQLKRPDDAKARLEAALKLSPRHLPALSALVRLALVRSDWPTAAFASSGQAHVVKHPPHRVRAALVAAALAQERIGAAGQALTQLKQVLELEPRNLEAFERLRRVYAELRDYSALGDLYRARLGVETDPTRLTEIRLELAKLAEQHLGDHALARLELRHVVDQNPARLDALKQLSELYFADKQWIDAVEILIRRARLEKAPAELKDIFFRLGIIYTSCLPDAKRAAACFHRVLQIDPANLEALEHLARIQLEDKQWRGALGATLRLAELEPDTSRRIQHLHQVAQIYQEGYNDARHALEALRQAHELDPMYLPAIGELARFFDRQSDVQSMRVHLDRAAARVRSILESDPYDAAAYHALFQMFGWRRAGDRAAMAAGILEYLGAATPEEKGVLAKVAARDGYPGTALADPALDDTLFDPRIPAGFRHLFRLLDEPLGKLFRADPKQLGLTRQERLPRSGHPLRDLAVRIAGDLGVREFDLYVTATHPKMLLVELTDPPSLVLGMEVVGGASELELRFLLGRCLKMIQAHMALPMRLPEPELGVLLGGILRQFVPDFLPAGVDERAVAAEAQRLAKLVPKKLHTQLLPFALECASDALNPAEIAMALLETANRAGLLISGSVGPALGALRRLGDERQVRVLLRFAVSEELGELRRQVGTSLG